MENITHAVDPLQTIYTLLEAPETKQRNAYMLCGDRFERDYTLSTTFRHSGWRHERRLIVESFSRTSQPHNRIRQYSDCGSHSYVVQSSTDPQHFKVVGSSCHDRFCLPCAKERSQSIAHNVIEQIELKRVRFLTLTLKSADESLSELLDHLYDSFRSLRRRKFWQKHVTGGVAFLEIKWNESLKRWHPHFHCLIEGSYLDQNKLSKEWRVCTGGSFIVDIRLVKSHTLAARYITKYASKPFNNTFVNRRDRLDEAVKTLKGRRLILTFDKWRGVLLSKESNDEIWEYIDSLDSILRSAAHGNVESIGILNLITDRDLQDIYSMVDCGRSPPVTQFDPSTQYTFFDQWRSDGMFDRFLHGNCKA